MTVENGNVADPQIISLLLFHLDDHSYGLSVMSVMQIIEMVALIPLPDAPPSIPGLINVRGEAIPVMDLRLRFGLPSKPYDLRTPIILVEGHDYAVGLIVDSVKDVLNLSPAELVTQESQVIATLHDMLRQPGLEPFLTGIANINRALIPVLDVKTLLSQCDLPVALSTEENQSLAGELV